MEFDKKESMKLLSYLEGELQARDIGKDVHLCENKKKLKFILFMVLF